MRKMLLVETCKACTPYYDSYSQTCRLTCNIIPKDCYMPDWCPLIEYDKLIQKIESLEKEVQVLNQRTVGFVRLGG